MGEVLIYLVVSVVLVGFSYLLVRSLFGDKKPPNVPIGNTGGSSGTGTRHRETEDEKETSVE